LLQEKCRVVSNDLVKMIGTSRRSEDEKMIALLIFISPQAHYVSSLSQNIRTFACSLVRTFSMALRCVQIAETTYFPLRLWYEEVAFKC
jgi:hypothetical protein